MLRIRACSRSSLRTPPSRPWAAERSSGTAESPEPPARSDGAFPSTRFAVPRSRQRTRRPTPGAGTGGFTSSSCSFSSTCRRGEHGALREPINDCAGADHRKTRRNRRRGVVTEGDRKDLGRVRTWELLEQAVGQGDHQRGDAAGAFEPPRSIPSSIREYTSKKTSSAIPPTFPLGKASGGRTNRQCWREISSF